jgi:hypothetical protein
MGKSDLGSRWGGQVVGCSERNVEKVHAPNELVCATREMRCSQRGVQSAVCGVARAWRCEWICNLQSRRHHQLSQAPTPALPRPFAPSPGLSAAFSYATPHSLLLRAIQSHEHADIWRQHCVSSVKEELEPTELS